MEKIKVASILLITTFYHIIACLSNNNISTDESALVALKSHISYDPLGILATNWSAEYPICQWIGVTCGPSSRVIALDIGNMGLTGTIPPHLGNLSSLVYLNLSRNNFHGNLPNDLGKLRQSQVVDFGVNNLTGLIPSSIFDALPKLHFFSVANNSLTGTVPTSIYNVSKIERLWLHFNFLQGSIPKEVGNLVHLKEYIVFGNKLSGSLPAEIFNISTLEWISLGYNYLSGTLPNTICRNGEHKLNRFSTSLNNLSGPLPSSFSNCSQLRKLSLSENKHTGFIPQEYGNMKLIQTLNLCKNNLTGEIPKELGNATTLEVLQLRTNQLTGCIPEEIGYLYGLQQLILSQNDLITGGRCNIKNGIPEALGNLSSLIYLGLYHNKLSGSLSSSIKNLKNLQNLDVGYNSLSGTNLEEVVCGLPSLFYIELSRNKFSGSIPECLGNITTLRYIYLDSNTFGGSIPITLGNLKDLLELDLSTNFLNGSLPLQVGNIKTATIIDLSINQLSGDLPKSIGNIQTLQILHLHHNKFQGSIPESIGELSSLESLNLSHNKFSGLIPKSLEHIPHLKYFNVSFNNLSGEIPSRGPFQNFNMDSFFSNKALCGEYRFRVAPCPAISTSKFRKMNAHWLRFVLAGIGVIIGVIALGALYLGYKRKYIVSNQTNHLSVKTIEKISYYELITATNGYDESNLLGKGTFGSVYKGTLDYGRIVAVKVFNLQLNVANKSFEGECEVLRNLHHRNITKVITSCTNLDFKALVLEYIPNGSLDKWLYSHNYCLNVIQRLNIMMDVATALHYLHLGYSTPIVHCDLKPSNVLLDQEMVARISDFGIAKMLGKEDSITYTETLGTFGYVAPAEYGSEGLVSTRCDIYSFGIMMMEVFTRIRPNQEMLKENMSLRSLVSNSFPNSLAEIIDSNLMLENEDYFREKLECITSVMELALICTREAPRERISIGNVIITLRKIKHKLSSYCTRV